MKIVLATGNKNKIREIKEKFSALKAIEVSSLEELPMIPEIEETADTFEGNALIKAREICRLTGSASLADDSGLAVDALNGEPGVRSARYGGPGLSDEERYRLLLSRMEKIPDSERAAAFICAIAIVLPDGREYSVQGQCGGVITREPSGTGGFGYDPVFFITERGKTMAELTPEEKNLISHRGRAIEKAMEIIKEITMGRDIER